MTQTDRLHRYLLSHPGASSLEIIRDLAVTNATGRVSDLRLALEGSGFVLIKERRPDNRWGYAVVPVEEQQSLGLAVA